jgi:hypothetical protein
MKSSLFTLLLWAAPVLAADLPPALKSLAEQFDKNRAALTTYGEAQLAPARDRYVAVLTTAQATATAATKTADVAAITGELAGVKVGTLPTEPPPDLPKTLLSDRRTYIAAAANVARTVVPRQRDLTAKYLQALASLEVGAQNAKDTALSQAVDGEKQRVAALLEVEGGGAKHRNIIANGDFSEGQDGAAPPDWKNQTEVSVTDAITVTEGMNKYLRFRRIAAIQRANLEPAKEIPVPANAKSVELSFKMRAKGVVAGAVTWDKYPGITLRGKDARGEDAAKLDLITKMDTPWHRYTGRMDLPATAKILKVGVGPHNAAGIIDFDDIEVQFR